MTEITTPLSMKEENDRLPRHNEIDIMRRSLGGIERAVRMRIITIIFILAFFATPLAAIGDIDRSWIQDTGWTLSVNIDLMDSSGVYKFNWATNHTPTDTTPYLIVKSLGYDSITGARINVNRKVYIDTVLRRNYPNNGNDSAIAYGSDSVVITFALSSQIFTQDTIDTIYIPKNVYHDGVDTQKQIYSYRHTTNNSKIGYNQLPRKLHWTKPDRDVVDDNFEVRFMADHHFAQHGKAVACAIVTAEDNHSHIFRDTIFKTVIRDDMFTDSIKIPEYVCTVSVATFTKDDSITVNCKILPWIGDSIWTGDGVNSVKPTPLYAPQYYLYAEQYVAMVNAATGNDGTGAVVWEDDYNPSSPPNKFATIGGAVNAIRAAKGATDIKGGRIICEGGNYTFWGSTITTGTFSSFNLTIEHFDATTVSITGASGSTQMPADSYIKMHGITWAQSTGNIFQLEKAYWADSCFDNRTGGVSLYVNVCNYATRCRFGNVTNIPYSTQNNPLAICRGCEFKSTSISTIVPYCFIGNKNSSLTGGVALKLEYTSMTCPKPNGSIIGYNYMARNANFLNIYTDSSSLEGPSFINNVLEITAAVDLLSVAVGDNSMFANGVSFSNNTFVGYKCNLAYNNVALTGVTDFRMRRLWSFKNNIFHYRAIVTDDDSHGGAAGNARQGNWSVVYGTDCYGNIVVSDIETYTMDFPGLKNLNPDIEFVNDGRINNYIKFIGDSSYIGSAKGFGNYHLAETSPAILFTDNQVLNYDMDGKSRGEVGAVGAYTYGSEATPDSSTLTLTQSTGGTVSADPVAAKRQAGDQSVIAAVPDIHYTFNSWTGDLSDSTGSPLTYNYPASGSYTASAYFRLDTVIVFYDPNGASGEPPTAKLIGWGQTFTVPGPGALTFAGYGFTGWNTAADGSGTDYAEGSTYTGGSANQTLYAQWELLPPRYLTVDTTGNGSTNQNEGVPQPVPDGDSVLVVYMADMHNHYVSTTVTGGATARDTASGAQWIIVSGGDGEATFNFGPDTFGLAYTITGGNAAVTYLSDSIAAYNESITCTLTVSTGYTADWPGGHVGAGKHPLTVVMTKDSTLDIVTHALPVYTVDTTWGAYLSAWTVSGGLSHDSGTTISMSATCEACSSFTGYTGGYTGSGRNGSFVITGNVSIGAGCGWGTCGGGSGRSLFGFLRSFRFGWR